MSAGAADIFIAKLDNNGDHLWSYRFGGERSDTGFSVATGERGSVFLTGEFQQTVRFGGEPLTSAGYDDIFVAKFDLNGHHNWSERFGDPDGEGGWAISVDRMGGVFLTGVFEGEVDFGGGPLTSVGDRDVFITKFADADMLSLPLDIKPGSCPNPLNVRPFDNLARNVNPQKGGVLPVAILGTGEFDVTDIDVSTLLLEGVAPLRHGLEDVAAPVSDDEAKDGIDLELHSCQDFATSVANNVDCECTTEGPDGHVDLALKFQKSQIVAALGPVKVGDVIPLTLMGELSDGTPFEATDCVTIVGGRANPPDGFRATKTVVLQGAVPNPFNPITRIGYVLPREDFVRLSVFDVKGRMVEQLVARTQLAGEHVVEWDAGQHASGIYFYRLTAGNRTLTKKMVLLK
jgi:hypothetical protein